MKGEKQIQTTDGVSNRVKWQCGEIQIGYSQSVFKKLTSISASTANKDVVRMHFGMKGKSYEDKGIIKKIVPEKILQSTYWSNLSGAADKLENYMLVTYELKEENGIPPAGKEKQAGTRLIITQENCKTEESRKHSQENWRVVLDVMKKLLEK